MRKIPLNTAILTGALVVFLALPSAASAGQVVPPGNSAATQYTQVFPTSGGNVAVGKSIGESGGGKDQTPDKVIGKKTTKELEAHGPEGSAVAELAAESAPTPEPETSQSSSGGSTSGGDDAGAGKHANGGGHKQHPQDGAKGQGGQQGSGEKTQQQPHDAVTAETADSTVALAADSGSSGFSSVLGQTTGASSGQMGAFLPLILIATLVVALAYAWWRRQHEQRAAP